MLKAILREGKGAKSATNAPWPALREAWEIGNRLVVGRSANAGANPALRGVGCIWHRQPWGEHPMWDWGEHPITTWGLKWVVNPMRSIARRA